MRYVKSFVASGIFEGKREVITWTNKGTVVSESLWLEEQAKLLIHIGPSEGTYGWQGRAKSNFYQPEIVAKVLRDGSSEYPPVFEAGTCEIEWEYDGDEIEVPEGVRF